MFPHIIFHGLQVDKDKQAIQYFKQDHDTIAWK
jgi:hypothetical protein